MSSGPGSLGFHLPTAERVSVDLERFTLTKFLLLLNQALTLVILCAHIRIFTLNRDTVLSLLLTTPGVSMDSVTISGFFLSGFMPSAGTVARGGSFFGPGKSNNVMLLLITMVILFRLVALCDQKIPIITASAITIVAQASLSTAFMAMSANGMTKLLANAPIPGPSFKGCFPILSREDVSAVWFSAMAVQCLGMVTAVYFTIWTWRASDSYSFLALAQRNGIFHFMAITFSTIFSKAFCDIAPKSLALASTPVPMAIYGFFGSLLLLNLLEQQNSPLDLQAELSTFLYRSEIDDAGLSAKGRKDLEFGLLRAPALSKKVHRTPDGEIILSTSPCVEVMSAVNQGAEKQSPAKTSPSAVAPPEQTPTCTDQIRVEEELRSRFTLATLNMKVSDLSLGRRHSSEDSSATRRIETLEQQQIDEWAALDEALSEEYDEDEERWKPKRTHERKWKSDDITPPTRSSAAAPRLRFSELNFRSSQHTLMSPTPPWTFSSNAATPFSSFPIPPSQTKKVPGRSRLSALLNFRHPSQESCSTPTPVPVPVLEEATDIAESLPFSPMSPPIPNGPSQPLQPPSSVRRNSQSSTARTRRLPKILRVSSSAGAPPRGDSDGVTISSASTGWAFDNHNTRDAPDFGN
ncbi:hypothetical protein FRB95_013058 [Tulasnella sp. JGI-2019a]|nr:hypothetical protein FRB95_013058 [Tulasnella sp. JGI-2019a]